MNAFYLVLDTPRKLLSTSVSKVQKLRKTTFKFGFKDGDQISVPGFITVHWAQLTHSVPEFYHFVLEQ